MWRAETRAKAAQAQEQGGEEAAGTSPAAQEGSPTTPEGVSGEPGALAAPSPEPDLREHCTGVLLRVRAACVSCVF